MLPAHRATLVQSVKGEGVQVQVILTSEEEFLRTSSVTLCRREKKQKKNNGNIYIC